MAHYAFLDNNLIVTQVIVGKDESDEIDWEQYYANVAGQMCKRTSFNTSKGIHLQGGEPFRKNYAGIGYTYDPTRDAFIPPRVYNSWTLNEDTCCWESPVAYPSDGKLYYWDEDTTNWVEQS